MGIKAALAVSSLAATLYSLPCSADDYVGTTRWVSSKRHVSVCEFVIHYGTGDLPACHTAQPGTALKIIRKVTQKTEYTEIDAGYAVEEPSGQRGYISSTDAIFMLSQTQKQEAEKASATCKKRGGVAVGMTAEQVLSSCWGKPSKVNETLTANGRHQQWVYGGGYVYLDNGAVTAVQTSK